MARTIEAPQRAPGTMSRGAIQQRTLAASSAAHAAFATTASLVE
jgi:hypothetical protein